MKFIEEIAEILEIEDPSSLKDSDLLEEHDFDSLGSISLISYISDNSDVEIDAEEIENLKTIKDLDNFLSIKLDK